MLLDVIMEDKFLTGALIIVGVLWFLVFLRNMRHINKKAAEFEQLYNHILSAEEFKVKGKYDTEVRQHN